MRLIDADALVAKMKALDIWHETEYQEGYFDGFSDGIAEVEEAPTIEAEPVKHGRWEDGPLNGYLHCSACKDVYIDDTWLDDGKWSYCPNCGAKGPAYDAEEDILRLTERTAQKAADAWNRRI